MAAEIPRLDVSSRLATARDAFDEAVRLSEPYPQQPPLWIESVDARLSHDIAAADRWMSDNHAAIEQALLAFGAIVWRGLPVVEAEDFARLMRGFEPFAPGYVGGTSDRKPISGNVMEATRTPPDYCIHLHQEMSYMLHSPRLVTFHCKVAPTTGGETIICDMRGVLEALPAELQRKLLGHSVDYVRHMRTEAVEDWRADPIFNHPSWQYKFETDDRAVVEAQLRERGAEFAWDDEGGLSFWTRVPGVTTHPVTGDLVFFNQMNSQVQHRLTVGDERAKLIEDAHRSTVQRPYSVRFSNGEALSEDEFIAIHAEFERRKVAFPWRAGDVMLLENTLTGHGRHPFTGPREVQVMLFQ